MAEFCDPECHKSPLLCHSSGFRNSSEFHFFRFGLSKSFLLSFLRAGRKTVQKHTYDTTLIQKAHFDLMAYDDRDLKRGHQWLRKEPRSIPDTTHAGSSALLPSETAALQDEA